MKKEYMIPYTEIIKFQEDDFITTSIDDGGDPVPGRDDWLWIAPDIEIE